MGQVHSLTPRVIKVERAEMLAAGKGNVQKTIYCCMMIETPDGQQTAKKT